MVQSRSLIRLISFRGPRVSPFNEDLCGDGGNRSPLPSSSASGENGGGPMYRQRRSWICNRPNDAICRENHALVVGSALRTFFLPRKHEESCNLNVVED